MSLVVRGILVWLLLLLAAVANGAIRQAWLIPWLGEHAGHIGSTLSLSVFIFGLGWLLSGWLDMASTAEAYLVGVVWLVLTIAFEFLGGHFLFGAPWAKLLADYNLAAGRIWILVLITTAVTPLIVFRLKR
jgi:hypothetical protein